MQITGQKLVENSYRINSIGEAVGIIGGKSKPFSEASKMPCFSYSIPATFCKTGEKLRLMEGSVCKDCYACPSETEGRTGGWYDIDRVQEPMTKRLLAVLFNPRWTDAMIFLFQHYKFPIFRWHDSGDIQSVEHLTNICKIADAIPNTLYWLPTQEWDMVIDYWNQNGKVSLDELHPNLIIRLSARMKDGPAPIWLARKLGVQTSRVSTRGTDVDCPASQQGNSCGPCRKCWNQKIECVTYHFHNGNDNTMKSEFVLNIKKLIDGMLEEGIPKGTIDKIISKRFSLRKLNVRLIRANMLKDYKRKVNILSEL